MIQGKSEIKKIQAKAGEPFKIRIWEDRTKGGCRFVPTFDSSILRLLSDEYDRMRNIRVTDSGMRSFEFVAMSPGKTTIELESRYGWKFSAESHLSYEVDIA
jgi:predicted secreted protein